MNKSLFRAACTVVVFIWCINMLANAFYWYSAMWWFDIPMHVLGGVFLALVAGALWFDRLVRLAPHDALVILLLFVVIVGLGWECFEYGVQALIKGKQLAHVPDSIKDLLMDTIGGTIGAYFVLRTVKRYNTAHANHLK
jgi:hypothetical protein